jgi:uncharacterized protein YicC (UPF0701 family)
MMDAQIRAELKNYIQRGKVDLYVNYEDLSESDVAVKYNHSVAAEYMKYLQQMADEFHLENDVRVSTSGNCSGKLSMKQRRTSWMRGSAKAVS